ncbi:uncharacterized protein LOC141596547 [Silene latifolia]|uniref:uncharacterized protein LOC141596547 n=1 Tax=Silene latifolia TaxID=37657 RepID=UPI003D7813F5
MLLSPGNSPRHLSSPSPTPTTTTTTITTNTLSAASPSPLPRTSRKTPLVLDEDTYVAAIEKIIERDYFPDIPKLRDRLDWLQAVKSADPVLIRDAQLKILERRRGSNTLQGKITTPGSSLIRNSSTPFEFDPTPSVINANSTNSDTGNDNSGFDVNLSLDDFCRRYTSEDNHSFNKIIEKVNRKRKERYGFLLEGEKTEEGDEGVKGIEDVKRDRITDGYGSSDQPTSTLDGWKYSAKNLLMYHPADRGEVALTTEERAHRLKGMTKEVDMYNTRFHGKMLESRQDDEGVEVLYTSVAGATPVMAERERDKARSYDLEDLRKTPNKFYVESEKKAENGFSFVRTPSPAPGVDESPFITWGEIEGTPLRLDLEDTPLDIGGRGDGPHFKIPCPPSRDIKAHSMSREAARKIKQRTMMYQKPPLPSPLRSGSASPNVKTLSPAAQKFMRNAMAKSSGSVDESLRASYRGNSPGLGTPKAGRSISRLGRDLSTGSRSPSVREGSNPPW